MAHYAEINEDNIVTRVTVVPNEEEHRVQEHLAEVGLTGRWIKCSYNTYNGVHTKGGEPLRGTFPSTGYIYDEELDKFFPRKIFPSWTWDEESYNWVSPIPKPEGEWLWSESLGEWVDFSSGDISIWETHTKPYVQG
jgi:hypothetical protein